MRDLVIETHQLKEQAHHQSLHTMRKKQQNG